MRRSLPLFISALILTIPVAVRATVVQAASCSQVDVQSAVDRAMAGDTVQVPSGNCTWTTPALHVPSVSITKAITLSGAGVDTSVITDGTGAGSDENPIDMDDGARVTGFTFLDPRTIDDYKPVINVGGAGWRVDHNKFSPSRPKTGVASSGSGLIDHNTFIDTGHGVDIYGEGDASWSAPSSFGTANNVFIEDNVFTYSAMNDGAIDAFGGARYVFRHNTVTGTQFGHHGFDSGGYRSPFSCEVYDNVFNNPNTHIFTTMNFRGGSCLIFNNTVTSNGGSYDSFVILENFRSDDDYTSAEGNSWGICNGANSYDGNTPGGQGYPCRDQIGPGTNQTLVGTYLWNNTYKGSSTPRAVVQGYDIDSVRATQFHILSNRDYFDNTPKLGYTPYTYPHPLAASASSSCEAVSPAKCWYVDSSISSSGNGTSWATAWKNISNITTGVGAGDYVYLSGGPSGANRNYPITGTWTPKGGSSSSRVTYKIGTDNQHNGTITFTGSGTWLKNPANMVINGDAGDGGRHIQLSGYDQILSADAASAVHYRLAFVNFGTMTNTGDFGRLVEVSAGYDLEFDHNWVKSGATGVDADIVFNWQTDPPTPAYDAGLRFHDNTLYAPSSSGGVGQDGLRVCCSGWSITNNFLSGYPHSGSNEHQDGLQDWQQGSYVKIADNIVQDFNNAGLNVSAFSGGYSHVRMYNNLIVFTNATAEQGSEGGFVGLAASGFTMNDIVIANNLIAGGSQGWSMNNSGNYGVTWTNSLIANNISIEGSDVQADTAHGVVASNNVDNISAATAGNNFISYSGVLGGTNNNFHLKTNANNLIGKGTNLTTYGITTDFDGNPRPATGAWDIGPFQFTTTPPPPADTQAPTVPAGLAAQAFSSTQINLSWTASNDNVAVTGYDIYRNGGTSSIAAVSGVSYADTGHAPSTTYTYQVVAKDAAGNKSNKSISVSATTLSGSAPSDTSPPPSSQTNLLPFKNVYNPSNGDLVIKFSATGPATITLYSRSGEKIKTLDASNGSTAAWDGRNESGSLVASGAYLCVLKAGEKLEKRKIVVVR